MRFRCGSSASGCCNGRKPPVVGSELIRCMFVDVCLRDVSVEVVGLQVFIGRVVSVRFY